MKTCSCEQDPWKCVLTDMILGDAPDSSTSVLCERGMFWVRRKGRAQYGPKREGYCEDCGDKLMFGGEVEKRADLERKAAALDRLGELKSLRMEPVCIMRQDRGTETADVGWATMTKPRGEVFGRTLLELADALLEEE